MKVGHPDEQRNAQDQRAVIARWFYQRLGFLSICSAYWPLRFTILGLATRFGIADIALGSPPSILVVAAATQRTLRQSRANVQRYPALLTKMMTLYLLFEALEKQQIHLHSWLRVSRSAAAKPPTALGLLPGQTISVSKT